MPHNPGTFAYFKRPGWICFSWHRFPDGRIKRMWRPPERASKTAEEADSPRIRRGALASEQGSLL